MELRPKTHPFSAGSDAGADWLKNKYHPISPVRIIATEVNIEPEIKWIIQTDLVGIPYTAALKGRRWRDGITITAILLGRAI
jgi:hypothetical protein